ncbi:DUF177 domain-containing protein [Thermodesulfobacteriota bacterium]
MDRTWPLSVGRKDDGPALDEPLSVQVFVSKVGDNFVLKGALAGGLQVRCDRCLETYHRSLSATFHVSLTAEQSPSEDSDVKLLEEDMAIDFISSDHIELEQIIREQIYLTLPIKSLCRKDCSGLCSTCGANLNHRVCECRRQEGHPGFLKLKTLKIK